jgi:hypothetical protein
MLIAGVIALVIMITIDGFTDPTLPLIVLIGCALTVLLIGKKKGLTYEEM